MYAVSDAFLTAVAANTRSYYWAGTITTIAGKVYEFGYGEMKEFFPENAVEYFVSWYTEENSCTIYSGFEAQSHQDVVCGWTN